MDPLNPLRDVREMAHRLPDPPYVHGDHAATCRGEFGWGCEECNPSDDGYCCITLARSGVCSCPDREQHIGR